jgi:phosphoribosylformylglycinamidine synthase
MQSLDLLSLPDVQDANHALLNLLATANIASKRWIYRQYDQSVLANTVVEAGADAAVMRIKGTPKGIALTTDGNGRYCHVNPYAGGAMAVAEAARNIVCAGAQPVAVTDCLNFGNPERPGVYYQMQEVVRAIADACAELGTPVVSGNVSLYNETDERAVYPTAVIGMLGILDDVTAHGRMGFGPVDDVFLGSLVRQPVSSLAGSEYLKEVHGLTSADFSRWTWRWASQRAALALIRQRIATACHDCSDGGLAGAGGMCLAGGKGLDASGAVLGQRLDASLFGEAQSHHRCHPPERRGALSRSRACRRRAVRTHWQRSREPRCGSPDRLSLEDIREAMGRAGARSIIPAHLSRAEVQRARVRTV